MQQFNYITKFNDDKFYNADGKSRLNYIITFKNYLIHIGQTAINPIVILCAWAPDAT